MMLFPESPFFLRDGFQHRRPLEKLRRKKRPNPSLRRPSEAPGFCVKRKANDVAQKKRKKAAGLRKHQNLSGSYGIKPSQASGSFPLQTTERQDCAHSSGKKRSSPAAFMGGIPEERIRRPPPCGERPFSPGIYLPFRLIRGFRRQNFGGITEKGNGAVLPPRRGKKRPRPSFPRLCAPRG